MFVLLNWLGFFFIKLDNMLCVIYWKKNFKFLCLMNIVVLLFYVFLIV